MLDLAQTGPIIDYLHNQRFVEREEFVAAGVIERRSPPQPNLSMKGRSSPAGSNFDRKAARRLVVGRPSAQEFSPSERFRRAMRACLPQDHRRHYFDVGVGMN